jgi:cellulose synthase (UDP-forming)
MILDCDHVPVRTFLSETLGFFSDPKVAFVQTPHHFYNPDTYQRNLRLERQIVNEQDLFFQIVQPGRDGFNSAFFAGTGGVFRRSALEGIGGFQVATLTEDLHTSLVLHAKGFRSIYLNKILAAGLSPESFRSYLRQRQRWTRGHMQLLLMSNPLWKRGLTFMQRIHYFASIFYFLHGIPRVIFLVAPLAYLLLGVPPLVAHVPTLLFYYLPYYFVAVFAFDLASEKARNPFWSELYETASCFSLSWAAVETLFLKQKKKPFHVTPKGQRFEQMRLDRASVLPHFVVGVLLTVGLVVGGYQLWNGRGNLDATMLSTFWTGYNLLLIWVGIFAAWERPQRRSSPRISREIPCQLRFNGVTVTGRTADISEGGLSLVPDQVSALPARLRVSLDGAQGERVELDGMVVRDDFFPSGQSSVGVHFVDLGEAQRQGLLRQIYSGPESWQIPMTSGGWRSLVLLATAAGRSLKREKALRRLSPRVRRRVQCYIVSADKVFKGVTEDISSGGACLRFEAKKGFTNRLASKVLIQFCNGGQPLSSVRGAIIRYEERPGRMFVCAVQFLPENALDPNLWRDASKEVRT